MKYLAILVALVVLLLIARRLYRHSGDTRELPEDIDSLMTAHAEDAVERARAEFDVRLDFSPDSVKRVESILSRLHDRHQKEPLDERELGREARLWGAYLGRVIKRVRPCTWHQDSKAVGEGALPLVFGTENETYPCAWVYKRIKNGGEDNVTIKFQILIMDRDRPHASAEFKPE